MPGLRIHDQHLHLRVHAGKVESRVCHDAGDGAAGGELHTGIQRAGKIISNNQQFDQVAPSSCVYI